MAHIVVTHGFFIDICANLLNAPDEDKVRGITKWCDYCSITAWKSTLEGDSVTKEIVLASSDDHVQTKRKPHHNH